MLDFRACTVPRACRVRLLAVLAAALASLQTTAAWSQADGEKRLVTEDRVVPAKDNWPLHFKYYKSLLGKEAPVVVLLHGKGGNQLVWEKLAGDLQRNGFAVITPDLRKHGKSKPDSGTAAAGGKPSADADELKPTDYALMLADMDALKDFIYEEHQAQNLNIRKLGIVAADMSAPIALNFALADWLKAPYPDAPVLSARTPRGQDVRALVLISPETSLPRLTTTQAVKQLSSPAWGVAFLVMVGADDKLDKGQARRLYEQVTGLPKSEERMYWREYEKVALRGTDLLGKVPQLENAVIGFLIKHVKELPDPWTDRKSRLKN